MAATKTFETAFRIGASFTGQKAFAQANKALTATQKTAMAVNRGIGSVAGGFTKLAGAIGLAAGAYAVLRKASEFWTEGVKASQDAVKVQEELGVAAQRNAKRYKTSGAEIVKSVNAITEKVAKVGFDSEDAAAGTTKLLESMSPKEIEAFSQSYADLTAKLKGATPGAEGFADVSEQVNTAILKGKAPWLAQLGYNDQQLKAFKKLTPAARRAELQQIIANRLHDEANRVFGTTAGKVAKAAKAYEDLQQAVTGPFVARTGEMADAQLRLYTALQPVADLLGKELGEGLKNFSKWTDENKDSLIAWGNTAVTWTKNTYNAFWWLQSQSESLFKPIAQNSTREFNNVVAGAQKAWEGVQNIWNAAGLYFEGVATAIGNAFGPLYEQIIKPFRDAWNYVESLWPGAAAGMPPTTGGAAVGTGGGEPGDYVPPWQEPGAAGGDSRRDYAPGVGPIPRGATPSSDVKARIAPKAASSAKAAGVNPDLLAKLDVLQSQFGKLPINSGYRSPAHNAAVGGARHSQHTKGQAVDIDVSDKSIKERLAIIDAASKAGIKGIGVYANALHFDVAGRRAWGPSYGRGSVPGWAEEAIQRHEKAAGLTAKPGPTANISTAGPQGNRQTAGTGERTQSLMEGAMMRSPGGAGGSLKHMIKEMNLQQRTSGATGGQNIAMNAPITVNGVAPGREALMAKKTALALRDPTAQLLTEIKRARTQEQRLGYV